MLLHEIGVCHICLSVYVNLVCPCMQCLTLCNFICVSIDSILVGLTGHKTPNYLPCLWCLTIHVCGCLYIYACSAWPCESLFVCPCLWCLTMWDFIGVFMLVVFDHVRVYWCVHACGVWPRESLFVCPCLWCLTTWEFVCPCLWCLTMCELNCVSMHTVSMSAACNASECVYIFDNAWVYLNVCQCMHVYVFVHACYPCMCLCLRILVFVETGPCITIMCIQLCACDAHAYIYI